MVDIILDSIRKFLESQEYDCELLEKSKEVPNDYLFAHLGSDHLDRDLILQINVTEQLIDPDTDTLKVDSEPKDLYHLQLMLELPYSVNSMKVPDVSRLLHILNKGLSMPGLELSEADLKVYYRTAMLIKGKDIDPYVLISLISSVVIIPYVFGEFIEAVSTGRETLLKVVEQIRDMQSSVPTK